MSWHDNSDLEAYFPRANRGPLSAHQVQIIMWMPPPWVFIGRIEKGFDFLGYRFTPTEANGGAEDDRDFLERVGGDRGQLPNSETYLTQTAILSTRIVDPCALISTP